MSRQTNSEIMAGIDDALNVKRIANNTVKYERANGDVVYRLHNTDVVTKHADGTFTLNSGGWKTPTTKDRINTYAPAHLCSGRGVWLIGDWRTGKQTPFYDNMRIDASGNDINAKAVDPNIVKGAADLKKKISKFVRRIDDCETLPTPNNGDCWQCLMFEAEKPCSDRLLEFNHIPNQSGPLDNPDHLISHMDEGYLHGSLLVNAMRWAGYSDEGISIYYGMRNRGPFKRALRRYLGRKLGLVTR